MPVNVVAGGTLQCCPGPVACGRRLPRDPRRSLNRRARRALAWVLALLPVLAFCEEFQTPAVTADELAARWGTADELLVVDVRPTAEYKTGHVAGAINIPYTRLPKRLDELRQAKNGVVLYCTFGTRTRLAEQTLLDNDIPNVFHLEGGLRAWRQGGHEIRTGWGP